MARQTYFYNSQTGTVGVYYGSGTAESTPTLETIKSWLRHPAGELTPNSIIRVDADSKLDQLNVDVINNATLNGGDF
jgi:hypothetical protein